MFDFFVSQGVIERSPFDSIPKPQAQDEVKLPLSQQQIEGLLREARRSSEPARDTAVVSMLLDTGCRASELVSIRNGDLDMKNRCCRVLGKGNKYRTIFFGESTARALVDYKPRLIRPSASALAFQEQSLFLSAKTGKPLQLSGLQQIMKRLKKNCGFRISCSPHALRRAFAVQTLKNGANVFSVQAMLGHTDLEMTQRYCFLAQADVEAQYRQFSPMDRLAGARQ